MNRFSITLAAALLASSAPAMAADPMEVRGVWLKG